MRLKQGLMDQATVFSDEPAEMALHWVKQGARRLHLVNWTAPSPANRKISKPSAPFAGSGQNPARAAGRRHPPIWPPSKNTSIWGCTDVIIGTAAVKNPQFVREACKAFAGHIIVGLDAKEGMVAIDGWATVPEHQVADLGRQFADDGVNRIIYTDIGRDGMMSGVNIEATVKLAEAVGIPVIASGGLH